MIVIAVVTLVVGRDTAAAQTLHEARRVDTVTYEFPHQGQTSRLSVDPRPLLEVGSVTVSEGERFHRVKAIVLKADHTFIVANGDPPTLLFYNRLGRLVRSVGGSGGGPGEYAEPSSVHLLPGDSIAVFDLMARRCTILTPTGRYVRSFKLEPPFQGSGPTLAATLKNGTLLVGYADMPASQPDARPKYFTQRVYQYTTAGTLANEVGRFPYAEHFVQRVPAEFGRVAYWDLAFGRRFVLAAVGNNLVGGDGSALSASFYSSRGEVLQVHRVNLPRRPVLPRDIERHKVEDRRRTVPQLRKLSELALAAMPFPSEFPAYDRLLVSEEGWIWLEEYPSPVAQNTSWIGLDPATRLAYRLSMPANFSPYAFTRLLVAGVWRDPDDVEIVRVYKLPTEVRALR